MSTVLIATEEGRKLYEKLGFHAVTTVHKYLYEHYTPLDLGYDMEYINRKWTANLWFIFLA
ncbi:hypothetical protein [Paenibacillus jiagnxiensis]|uniref:hypothetical protein n=1 Tax=Paenibacillus jiagnxiensis TaxID=3228926 RepID=UPI0033A85270